MQSNLIETESTIKRVASSKREERTIVQVCTETLCWIIWFICYLFSSIFWVNMSVIGSKLAPVIDALQGSPGDKPKKSFKDDGRLKPKLKNKSEPKWELGYCIFTPVMARLSRHFETRRVTRSETRKQNNDRNEAIVNSWLYVQGPDDLRRAQLADANIGKVLRWRENGKRPQGPEICAASPITRHYVHNWDSLEIHNGVLFRRFYKQNGVEIYLQLLVPESIKSAILHQMHNVVLSGHLAYKKTKEKTQQRFYWWGMKVDIENWIRKCDSCAANKPPPKKIRGRLGNMTVGAPLDRLGTDILGPLPRTPLGNRYILVVTDYFTKWVEIFAVPDQTAITCAAKILNEVVTRYGCPLDIHSDQGRNYESNIFYELCRMLEVRKTRTTARNPKCNGQTERFNKTLIRMIKAYLKGEQDEWDQYLGCLAAAYRATPHDSTGMTPNLLMLGREVRLPVEIAFGNSFSHSGVEITSYGDYVDMLREKMQKAHRLTRDNLQKAATRQKKYYDAKSMENSYKEGDLVWFMNESHKVQVCPKLQPMYTGPHVVIKSINDLNIMIQLDERGRRRVVHHDKLKPYTGEESLDWAATAIETFKNEKLPQPPTPFNH